MGRTVDQLPQASIVNPTDKLLISQDGISKKADQSQVGGGGGGAGPLRAYQWFDFFEGEGGVPWDSTSSFGDFAIAILPSNDPNAAEAFGVASLSVGGGLSPSKARMRLGASPAGSFRGELSPIFEGRVYVDAAGAGGAYSLDFGGLGAGGEEGFTTALIGFAELGSNNWTCRSASTVGGNQVDVDSGVALTIGWHTLRVEVDRDLVVVRYYVDDVLIYTETDSTAVPQSADSLTATVTAGIKINYFNPSTLFVDWFRFESLRGTPQ